MCFVLLASWGCSDSSNDSNNQTATTIKIDQSSGNEFKSQPDQRVLNGVTYTILNPYKPWVLELYANNNYIKVQNQISKLLAESVDEKSTYELSLFYNALCDISDESNTQAMEQTLTNWCRSQPASHIPWLVRGCFYFEYGWKIRGGGWANTVSKQSMQKFKDKLRLAKRDLEQSASLQPADPKSWTMLVHTAIGLSDTREKMESYFQSGMTGSSDNYSLCHAKLQYLLPKWHGTAKEMLDFATQCAQTANNNPYMGFIMVTALAEIHKYIKKDQDYLSREDVWAIVDGSFSRFFKKYPENLHRRFHYAYYAYLAKKYEIALEQFELIGNRFRPDSIWNSLEFYNKRRAFTYIKIGESYLFEKRLYEISLDYFQKAAALLPNDYTYYRLGQAYMYSGINSRNKTFMQQGERYLKKAVQLNGKNRKYAKDELKKLQKYKK